MAKKTNATKTRKAATNNQTSKKGARIMKKTANAKTAQAINYSENILEHPVDTILEVDPMILNPEVKTTKRDVTKRSTEWKVQVIWLDGATAKEVAELFIQIYCKERSKDEIFALKRFKKYSTQELNHIKAGNIINR